MNWDQAVNDFKYYMRIERGLSENSVDAYGRDIEKIAKYSACVQCFFFALTR